MSHDRACMYCGHITCTCDPHTRVAAAAFPKQEQESETHLWLWRGKDLKGAFFVEARLDEADAVTALGNCEDFHVVGHMPRTQWAWSTPDAPAQLPVLPLMQLARDEQAYIDEKGNLRASVTPQLARWCLAYWPQITHSWHLLSRERLEALLTARATTDVTTNEIRAVLEEVNRRVHEVSGCELFYDCTALDFDVRIENRHVPDAKPVVFARIARTKKGFPVFIRSDFDENTYTCSSRAEFDEALTFLLLRPELLHHVKAASKESQ